MLFRYHLAFFDVSKGILLKTLEDNTRKIEHFGLFPGNCFVAFDNSTLQNKSIALRNLESGSVELSYPVASNCERLEFSADGRWLAGIVEDQEGKGSVLDLWQVDYEIPASGCFMSRIRLTSTGGPLIGPDTSLGLETPLVAAVLPFTVSREDEDGGLGRAASQFLENRLGGSPHLRLIERSRIEDVLRELTLQKTSHVDHDTAVDMGKVLGARLMITGSLDRTGADLVISARIIDVRTGEILSSREIHCAQCGADDLFDAVDMLSRALVSE